MSIVNRSIEENFLPIGSSILDLWKKRPIEIIKQMNNLVSTQNMIFSDTTIDNYISLTEYYGFQGYFTQLEREDLASGKFREEISGPDMLIFYPHNRLNYISNYLTSREIRNNSCPLTDIREGQLIDIITGQKITEGDISINNRCYAVKTIKSIIEIDPTITDEDLNIIYTQSELFELLEYLRVQDIPSEEKITLLTEGLQNIITRNKKCQYGEMENGQLIDPISGEPIEKNELYFLNSRCYARSTIGEYIRRGKRVDPFSRVPLKQQVINEFIPSVPPVPPVPPLLTLHEITYEQLSTYNFPEHLNKLIINNAQLNSLVGINFPATLKKLKINYTQITSLDGVIFPNGLEFLSLSDNQITSLDGVILPLNLKELYLTDNQITSLNGVIFPLNLEVLYLSNNQITSLVGVIFPLNLDDLHLSYNQITSLVGVNLPDNITLLNLSNNQITSLNGVIFPLNLHDLILSNNQITSLDGVIFPLNLKELYLSDNQITSLNGVIFPLNLIKLYLSDNQISSLVDVNLPLNLHDLYLSNNLVHSLLNAPLNLRRQDLRVTF